MESSPCKTCEKQGCGAYHSQCEPFQRWLKLNEERKKKRHEEAILDNVVSHHRHVNFRIWVKDRGGRKR